jgi:hypothetical protein
MTMTAPDPRPEPSVEPGPTTYERLAEPFDLEAHATVNKGGHDQTYVPWTDYVERLNDVLGPSGWSSRVLREGFTATECWVLVEIEATIDGERVVRQQYGWRRWTDGAARHRIGIAARRRRRCARPPPRSRRRPRSTPRPGPRWSTSTRPCASRHAQGVSRPAGSGTPRRPGTTSSSRNTWACWRTIWPGIEVPRDTGRGHRPTLDPSDPGHSKGALPKDAFTADLETPHAKRASRPQHRGHCSAWGVPSDRGRHRHVRHSPASRSAPVGHQRHGQPPDAVQAL